MSFASGHPLHISNTNFDYSPQLFSHAQRSTDGGGTSLLCTCDAPDNATSTVELNITITPIDDPPELEVPAGFVFKPFRRVPTPLPVFSVSDPDSDASEIVYKLLVTGQDFYLEDTRSPGVILTTFSHQRVLERRVRLVYVGDSNHTRLILRLSNDGMSAPMNLPSSTYVIRVECQPFVLEGESRHRKSLDGCFRTLNQRFRTSV